MKGRIRILQKPLPKTPKKCIVSGRADGDVIDFGTDVEFPMPEPHVYIRRDIVEEAGEVCGMVRERDVEALRQRVADMESELESLQAIVAPLQAIEKAEHELMEAL